MGCGHAHLYTQLHMYNNVPKTFNPVAVVVHTFRNTIRYKYTLYLMSVLPFLHIFHVQHMADYLEEFLDTKMDKDEIDCNAAGP